MTAMCLALGLTALVVAGCADASPVQPAVGPGKTVDQSAEGPAGSVVSGPTGTAPSDGSAAPSDSVEQARDVLVQVVDRGASLIGGEAKLIQASVSACPPGLPDGVQFGYGVSLPDDQSAGATIERVSAIWKEMGIPLVAGVTAAYTESKPWEVGPGPVAFALVKYFDAYGSEPAKYTVEGLSQCRPGDPDDFSGFTKELVTTHDYEPSPAKG